MKRIAELLLAVTLTGFVAFQVGSCGRDAVQSERDAAHKLANHYRWQYDSLAVAQGRADTITESVIVADAKLSAERDSLLGLLAYADSVRRDSLATNADLRATIETLSRQTLRHIDRGDSLQAFTRDLISAHALERLATNRTLAAADSTIAAWKRVADAERRKGWRRFTQGAFLGGAVSLVAVLVL